MSQLGGINIGFVLPRVKMAVQDVVVVVAGVTVETFGRPVIDVDDQQYAADDRSVSDDTRRATATPSSRHPC